MAAQGIGLLGEIKENEGLPTAPQCRLRRCRGSTRACRVAPYCLQQILLVSPSCVLVPDGVDPNYSLHTHKQTDTL